MNLNYTVISYGQKLESDKSLGTKKREITEKAETFHQNEYEEWQKIDLEEVSFYLPKEIKEVKTHPYDSRFYRYENEAYLLEVEIGNATPLPFVPRDKPNYIYQAVTVEGSAKAWMWFSEREQRGFNYASGRKYVLDEGRNYAVFMQLYFKDIKDKETVEKIFTSVKLKPQSNQSLERRRK